MEKLKPCLLPCNLELLNDRINNLSAGLISMGEKETMSVNKKFLATVLDYMEELLGLRREEENRRAAPENKGCADCSGIVYRQTSSGKIIPADQRCGAKITPPCYQPDGDGCAYQIYGDNNDEPIDRCKACPLCYSDKVRHTAPENKALTLDELREMDGEPVFVASPGAEEYGHWVIVAGVDDSDGDKTLYCNGDFTCRNYGKTWFAYARRPEAAK